MEQPYIPYIPYMHTTPTYPAYTCSRKERGMNIDKGRQALLKHEVEIVWEEDPDDFDYVRERLDTYPNRRRIKKWRGAGRRVGYSVVALDAPSERGLWGPLGFYRREFFVLDHDRDSEPGGCYGSVGCPIEGVDPRTVRPGVPGEQNDRAWSGSLGSPRLESHAAVVQFLPRTVPAVVLIQMTDKDLDRLAEAMQWGEDEGPTLQEIVSRIEGAA
jgi:hypothetical protein